MLFGYACHCTTLGGEFNKICAEWAGYACDDIERQPPGAVAIAIIGCGADANPEPRRNLDDAKAARRRGGGRGQSPARRDVRPDPACPAGSPASSAGSSCRWSRPPIAPRSPSGPDSPAPRGASPATLLERLDRGEPIRTSVPYVVQTWSFGDDMAMVFLAGEVVVDYALRIKWETDAQRLWVVAYSNDVPCYIPSRRILSEGGYEADSSMIYYGHASRLAAEVEDLIVGAVHDILPPAFEVPAVGDERRTSVRRFLATSF